MATEMTISNMFFIQAGVFVLRSPKVLALYVLEKHGLRSFANFSETGR